MSQTKLHSLWESIQGAMLAMPSTILLHKVILLIAGENTINDNQDIYIFLSTTVFFLHGIIWKYIIRRLNEKYNVRLNPIFLYYKIKMWLRCL